MATLNPDALAKVTNFHSLVRLLKDQLDWPFGEVEEPENYVFEWDAAELGLKTDEIAKIREIKQLRPLVTHQPWGVFFISFEDKALSVTVLRRLLRNLVRRKRDSAQSAERQAWHQNDLMFATNFGVSGHRELAFIHFSDEGKTNDLPVMKVLGWNARDTERHNQYVATMLQQKLCWPDDDKNENAWRGQWSGAFEVSHNQVINTSKDLAIRLAALAQEMRARANQLLKAETDKGPMRTMLAAFRKNLIQDLNEDGFADMFAQTIAYGLLAAHISRPSGGPVADNLVDMVPKTNPFLRELFGTFLSLGGRDKGKNLDFDELGVRDVVDMLAKANMEAVLRDFGDSNPKEDPVIHFYELFLKQYDPEKRMQRGVFYTPRPVVNFIVRGVDEILRTEFGLELGLADTTTWGELSKRNDKITVPAHIKPETPFVQILDPATGTGTFLVEVIDLIYKRMDTHWNEKGHSVAARKKLWNEYVPQHLLPRLTGFELMMAPYAIAHLKVNLKLLETEYSSETNERLRIFLTNALEPERALDIVEMANFGALAHEAHAANSAKNSLLTTIIVGNPPYAGLSGNLSVSARALVERLKSIDGVQIQEKGALQFEKNLQDDYVKFLAWSEARIQTVGLGAMGLITNNGYLDALTLRGLRYSLSQTFQSTRVLDLHGSAKRNLDFDENVFEIQQGVAVGLFARTSNCELPKLKHHFQRADIVGSREAKYDALAAADLNTIAQFDFVPIAPFYQFLKLNADLNSEYRNWTGLQELMLHNSSGTETGFDELIVDFTKGELNQKLEAFLDPKLKDTEVAEKWSIKVGTASKLLAARQSIRKDLAKNSEIRMLRGLYRPFDIRCYYYNPEYLKTNSLRIMQHLIGRENLALIAFRQQSQEGFSHIFVTSVLGDKNAVSLRTREINYYFPLRLFHNAPNSSSRMDCDFNFTNQFLQSLDELSIGGANRRDNKAQLSLNSFNWIYAVLHAPSYRSRYAEFLKSDFPRIPTPGSRDLFANLVALGRELVALHLLKADEASILKSPTITFHGSGEARVARGYPEYENGKVMINANRWFEDVPRATWEFHVGGYQVLEKWLKDRAEKGGKTPKPGRVLTDEDILHYRRIVVALTETRRLMTEIDKVIETHGGWPGAFGGANGKAQ
jgi:predicted helicase